MWTSQASQAADLRMTHFCLGRCDLTYSLARRVLRSGVCRVGCVGRCRAFAAVLSSQTLSLLFCGMIWAAFSCMCVRVCASVCANLIDALNPSVTPNDPLLPMRSMLGKFTNPWCENRYFVAHESQLQPSTRTALRAALPWALRENPERCVSGVGSRDGCVRWRARTPVKGLRVTMTVTHFMAWWLVSHVPQIRITPNTLCHAVCRTVVAPSLLSPAVLCGCLCCCACLAGRYPFLMPPPEAPRCFWNNGQRCGWAGAGPNAERHPECRESISPVV